MKKVQAIAPLAALFTSLLLFNVEADTYVFHFAVWALALAVVTTSFERRATRILGINLTLLSLLLLIFEVVLIAGEISNRTPAHGVSSEEAPEFRHHHPILGVAPLPDRTYEVKKSWGDEVLFDVRYTIDQHGFRVTPPPRSPDAPAIVFIDRHPNALGAQALAEYMLSEVLGDYRPGSRPAPRSIESK